MRRRMRVVVRFIVLGLGRCRGRRLVNRLVNRLVVLDDFVVVFVLICVQWFGARYGQSRHPFGDRVEATAALLLVILLQLVSQRIGLFPGVVLFVPESSSAFLVFSVRVDQTRRLDRKLVIFERAVFGWGCVVRVKVELSAIRGEGRVGSLDSVGVVLVYRLRRRSGLSGFGDPLADVFEILGRLRANRVEDAIHSGLDSETRRRC